MAKKKRNFLADFERHLDLSDRAYIYAWRADKLYKAGDIESAQRWLKKAEALIAKAKALEPKV